MSPRESPGSWPECDVCGDRSGTHRMWCSEGGDPGLTLPEARALVVEDQRRGFPGMAEDEAVSRALETTRLPWMPYAPASSEVTDESDRVARAYMTLHLFDRGKWSDGSAVQL